MIKKLRTQLLIVLLFFGGINILLLLAYTVQNMQKYKIEDIESQLHNIEVLSLLDTKTINDFFTFETKRPDYFITKSSTYLDKNNLIEEELKNTIISLSQNKLFVKIDKHNKLSKITSSIDSIDEQIKAITELIYLRGFKDYGIEGEMRKHAHFLEQKHTVSLSELLMLRRHEKDFIIRNDSKYVDKFNNRINNFKITVAAMQSIDESIKSKQLLELDLYQQYFNKMVKLDSLIGIKNNTALKKELEKSLNILIEYSNQVKTTCNQFKTVTYKRLQKISLIIFFLIIVLSIYLSLALSKLFTKRLTLLSNNIIEFINSCFTANNPINVKKRSDEVGVLIDNVETLKQNIHDQINYLEIKVAQRTEEISTQNEQIIVQNKRHVDSLKYAKNIQEALLPNNIKIGETFKDHFIYYCPKDLVSGDFYWFKRINNKKLNISLIVIADCTGHGVPGAFMSMLGIAFLNDIVVKQNIKTTADILDKLRNKVLENIVYQNNEKSISDGIDLALCLIDHNNNKIQYSGANRDLIIIRNGELNLIKGNRMPVGRYVKGIKPFTFSEFNLLKGDNLYMFTDGFADQLGGHNGKKFLRKHLRELLIKISGLTMSEQKKRLEYELTNWQGNYEQTDDILVAGFRF